MINEVSPDCELFRFLPGAEYADAFSLEASDLPLDARVVATRLLGNRPTWISVLMAIRNAAVKPFGLKAPAMASETASVIGVFPVIEASERMVVLGFDDMHLDFRVIVTTGTSGGGGNRAILTTLVKTSGLAGRLYLMAIKPLHRKIVRALLAQKSV
jgi:Protein of unknown function (DUF2867)